MAKSPSPLPTPNPSLHSSYSQTNLVAQQTQRWTPYTSDRPPELPPLHTRPKYTNPTPRYSVLTTAPIAMPVHVLTSATVSHPLTTRIKEPTQLESDPTQREVLARFYVPLFISSSQAAQATAEQRRADSKHPPIDANSETIARWMCQPQTTKPRIILGVIHLTEPNMVSLRSIRGRRMTLSREPETDRSAMASVRIAYFINAVEVVLTPSYHANFLHENAILTAFPIPEPSRYPRDPQNISMDDMARFFASQGLAVEDIHNAALFAYVWLRDIKAVNVDIVNLVFQLRYQLYPLLMKHGIPAGADEDLMNVDGLITHQPSAPTAGEFLERINIFPHNTAIVVTPEASTSQTHQAVSIEDMMDTSDPSTSNVIPNDLSMDTV
ncbi:hypothetical protein FB446DRAFT_847313 [Lentinula raphanica]|nr:hypothetical protein FB446DRAFT_847313 [Lentinula raphanica]